MRLAAGGAPVSVQRRAVQSINKVKILHVYTQYIHINTDT
jgi:hypothetical protein